jgi:hypothetical protein
MVVNRKVACFENKDNLPAIGALPSMQKKSGN